MKRDLILKRQIYIALFLLHGILNVAGQTSLKIMPLGNSVTRGSMCTNGDIYTCVRIEDNQAIGYRFKLFNLLNEAGYSFDFVGSQQYGSAIMSDPDNAGFSGIRDDQLAEIMLTGTSTHTGYVTPGAYLNYFPADIILLHIGTNDVLAGDYNSDGAALILDAIKDHELASGEPILVFLAKIISCEDNPCNTHAGTIAYNNNLVAMAQARINNGDHIVLVDMECGAAINYFTDLADQVHPNQTGYEKMADKWFEAIHQYNNAPVVANIPDQSVNMFESFNPLILDNFVTDLENIPQEISWEVMPQNPEHINISIDDDRIVHVTVKDSSWCGTDTVEFIATDRGRVLIQLQKSASTTVTFTVSKPDPPAAPSELSATAASTNTIELSWQDNAVNEDSFEIYRSAVSDDHYALIHIVSADADNWTDTSCTENTKYYYRVRAYNLGGYSSYSNKANAVTYLGIPAPPAELSAFTDSVSSVFLAWKDNSANEEGFEIERSVGEGEGFVLVYTTAMDITAYTDTGLLENVTYSYRIRALNAAGTSAYSEPAVIIIPYRIPDAPVNLRELLVTHQSVMLAWDNPSQDETCFELQYSVTEEGPFDTIPDIGPDVFTYVINGLSPDTYYYFRIRTLRDTLKSPFTAVLTVKTLVDPNLPSDISDTENGTFMRNSLVVYPNPVKEKAVLSFSLSPGNQYQIRLYDMQGGLVHTQPVIPVSEKEKTLWELDTSALMPGIYMLVLSTQDETLSKQIVIEGR